MTLVGKAALDRGRGGQNLNSSSVALPGRRAFPATAPVSPAGGGRSVREAVLRCHRDKVLGSPAANEVASGPLPAFPTRAVIAVQWTLDEFRFGATKSAGAWAKHPGCLRRRGRRGGASSLGRLFDRDPGAGSGAFRRRQAQRHVSLAGWALPQAPLGPVLVRSQLSSRGFSAAPGPETRLPGGVGTTPAPLGPVLGSGHS
ncbi:hypothetical protein G5714_024724 [Onychostoma macrolepis]|uniref:Uncharacterized protein n=1 Tax=Onychostoma macrolepis TaxID=369639 RepID=A0A7J6BLI7_9TELE|nr:hypothetical protein G5714_024724 [Onychostoma macrolepis]